MNDQLKLSKIFKIVMPSSDSISEILVNQKDIQLMSITSIKDDMKAVKFWDVQLTKEENKKGKN